MVGSARKAGPVGVEHGDLFQTLAQVAAAFAGFAGVISVFGPRPEEPDDLWPLMGARTIIEASLFTILFALLPFLVRGFGAEPPTGWRISSGLFLALLVAGAFGGTHRIWSVGGSAIAQAPLFLLTVLIIGIADTVLLVCNLLGLSFGSPATVYLVCLLGPLSVAGLTFLQMVVRISRPRG